MLLLWPFLELPWEIFITVIFGHSFVEIPNNIMVSSISFLKLTIQRHVQEKLLSLPSSWILCLEPGYLLPGLALWAFASSESFVHTLPWWRPELGSLHTPASLGLPPSKTLESFPFLSPEPVVSEIACMALLVYPSKFLSELKGKEWRKGKTKILLMSKKHVKGISAELFHNPLLALWWFFPNIAYFGRTLLSIICLSKIQI